MPAHKTEWMLACFDLDGTLVPGTSTCQHLAAKLGHLEHMTQLELAYSSGKISNDEVAELLVPYYAGLSLETIKSHLESLPIINSVSTVVKTLAGLGIDSLICTVSWRFAAQILAARYGFVGATGVEMRVDRQGVIGRRVTKNFDEFDKRAFVRSYCADRQIPMSRVFAVGDSRSDIPLFGAVGFSVALNATPTAIAAASVAIQTDDLTDVLKLVPGLLER
jgi:phosphoserine phosphatase